MEYKLKTGTLASAVNEVINDMIPGSMPVTVNVHESHGVGAVFISLNDSYTSTWRIERIVQRIGKNPEHCHVGIHYSYSKPRTIELSFCVSDIKEEFFEVCEDENGETSCCS